jgi:hypothetical protein
MSIQSSKIFKLVTTVLLAGVLNVNGQQTPPSPYDGNTKINYIRAYDAISPVSDPLSLMTGNLRQVKQSTEYVDGVGRPLQAVIKQGSLQTGGSPVDVVSSITYDEFGRESYSYLPFASTATDGTKDNGVFKMNPFQQQVAFYNSQLAGQTGEANVGSNNLNWAYSKTKYENSPMMRVEKNFAPGTNWVGQEGNGNYTEVTWPDPVVPNLWHSVQEPLDRSVKIKYRVNWAGDDVKIWTVSDVANDWGNYSVTGTYAAGQLYKTVSIDEHNKQVVEFRDKEERIILKKTQLTAALDIADGSSTSYDGWLCTYYIYDNFGRLRSVIQPEGVKALVNGSWSLTGTILSEQCFRYEFDSRGRMIMKKVPGSGEVYMAYDILDRLVMTQDANMRAASPKKWMVVKYDAFSRPIETGLWQDNTPFATHLTTAASSTSYPATPSGYETLTITHYDDYAGLPPGLSDYLSTWNNEFAATSSTIWPYPQMPQKSTATLGLATWTQVKVLGTSTFLNIVNYYDDKGRVIQSQSTNLNGGVDVLTTQYSWTGQPLIAVLKTGISSQTSIIVTRHTYDDLGRVVKTEKKISNTLVTPCLTCDFRTIAENEYDALGNLKKKKLAPAYNGNAGLESLTYDYNIRGWMLGANRDYAKDAVSTNWFGFDLGYDKASNGIIGNQTYNNPQHNGNIGGMVWKSKGNGEKRKYDFNYDAANRLMKADFTQYTSGAFNQLAGVNFDMKIGDGTDVNTAYDANGNIKRMQQWGLRVNGTLQVDHLRYTYENGSNKLKSVTDFNNDYQTVLGDFRTAVGHSQYAAKSALNMGSSQASFDAMGT